jgi:hypothetical protein
MHHKPLKYCKILKRGRVKQNWRRVAKQRNANNLSEQCYFIYVNRKQNHQAQMMSDQVERLATRRFETNKFEAEKFFSLVRNSVVTNYLGSSTGVLHQGGGSDREDCRSPAPTVS